jgi:cytochrome c-type biogenesis protein CcmF
VTVADYTARLDAIRVTDDGRKQAITAHITILRDGAELTKMYPARWFFRKHEDQPTTEVGIRRTLPEDLYIVMPEVDAATQEANLKVVVSPLINWLWVGFGLLAVGTLIALLPDAAFAFAAAQAPARAATAAMLLLALGLNAVPLHAQHVFSGDDRAMTPSTAEERDVTRKLACWCGGCPKHPVGECECTMCRRVRAEAGQLLKSGMNERQILEYFVKQQGGYHVLSEPPDEGFNRLSWMFPYFVAGAALITLMLTARRWSRPAAAGAHGAAAPLDAEMDARLDDELRNLD